jgi:Arc/MetJ-type ribon-helix-helix transcriptional regulator
VNIVPGDGESTNYGVKIFVALKGQVRLLLERSKSTPSRAPSTFPRMASHHLLASTPLTFELPSSLVDQIHSCRGRLGLKSASEVVRHALARFDFEAFQAPARDQCQISVRLAPDQKRTLFRSARQKKVSAGELLRAALETLSPRPASAGADRKQQSTESNMSKKAAKKPAKKKPAKGKK